MKKTGLLLALIFSVFILSAQNPADRDVTFNVTGLGTIISGTGQQFSKVTALPGGKVLMTGSFYSAAGTTPTYSGIIRLNNDGSFDNTFNTGGAGAGGIVAATAIQQDGKILIGGGFVSYNGTPLFGIARLHPDGSLDQTFSSGSGFSSPFVPWVRSMAIQPDGKIVVAGAFTSYNGTAIPGACRLNPDGSLDNTFSPGSGPNNIVEAVALQSDGKIIVGGLFGSFNGVSTGKIARLNQNGSVDNTFTSATSGDILRLLIQPDDKILASGGNFYRLESNGSLDAGFTSVTADNSYNGIALQKDGKIILSGAYKTYLSTPRERIVRLNTDGTVDPEFDSAFGFATNPQHIAIQPDGKILSFGGSEYKGVGNAITRIMGTPQSVSVEANQQYNTEISVYPNPASDEVVVDLTGIKFSLESVIISLLDLQGKTILETTALGAITTLNVSTLEQGIYFLRVQNMGHIISKKVLIF